MHFRLDLTMEATMDPLGTVLSWSILLAIQVTCTKEHIKQTREEDDISRDWKENDPRMSACIIDKYQNLTNSFFCLTLPGRSCTMGTRPRVWYFVCNCCHPGSVDTRNQQI